MWKDIVDVFYPYKNLFPGVIFVLLFIRLLNPFLTRERVARVRFPETELYDKVYAHMWANIASANGFENSKGLLESLN